MIVSTDTWIQAQQSVVGSCLIDDRCVSKIVFGLTEQDFAEAYRTMYCAIRDLYTTGKAVDPVTVLAAVGPQYKDTIVQLMEMTPTAANIDAYIEIVRQQSRILQLRDCGKRLSEIDNEDQGNQILSDAASYTARNEDNTWSLSQSLTEWMRRYERKPDYLDWFIPHLRRVIRAEKSDFFILGGRPSDGKSAFALQSALYWSVVCGKRVGFFSHETSREKLTDRLISCGAGVPLEAIKERKLTDKEMEAVCKMAYKIAEAPLYLISASGMTVPQMQEKALHKHLDIVIVDYLQIVSAPGDTEYAQVTAVSKGLHTMCQRYGIFCLALCQLSRTKGERPRLEDLRSSGQIEQDADGVFFLHPLAEPERPREFIIAKNKDGELNVTKLAFDGAVQQFKYLGKGQQPIKAFDYSDFSRRKDCQDTPVQGQMTLLPEDTPVPFEK